MPTLQNVQTLKPFVAYLLANCLSLFDHFVLLALKGSRQDGILFSAQLTHIMPVVETSIRDEHHVEGTERD